MRELLAVQALDTAIDQARHQLAHLPEIDALSSAQAELASCRRARSSVAERWTEINRQQKRFEDEAAIVEAKASGIEAQLYGGGKSIRELEALNADLASLKRRQMELEDLALEKMEENEPIGAELASAEQLVAASEDRVGTAEDSLVVAQAEVQARLDTLGIERSAAAEPVDGSVLEMYDRLRSQLGGVAIAELVGPRCQGCHLNLSAVDIDQIRKLSADDPAFCPECGRILVRRQLV